MKITFTTIFNRKNALNKEGKALIEVVAYQNRKRKYFSTKIFITPFQWDAKLRAIKPKHPQSEELNSQIQEMIRKLEKVQSEHYFNDQPFTIDNIKKELINKDQTGSFIDFVNSEITNNKVLSAKTKVSHKNMLTKLQEFKKGQDVFFSEIDYSFVDDFVNYLREHELADKTVHKLAENTVHKIHKNLQRYCGLAVKKGCMNSNPCTDIKIKYEQKKRAVLTIDEIKSVETLDLKKFDERISVVRDMFIFACYSGLRISDVTHLKPEYVKKEKEGYVLDFITLKVHKQAEIPLYNLFKMSGAKRSKPEIILEKYFNKDSKYIFPSLPEPFINRNLKGIAEMAKIPVKVTFHTSRHSFGTYMSTKIPIPQLMYLMQHSDIRTTMIYVNTSQELVKQGLMKVDWE